MRNNKIKINQEFETPQKESFILYHSWYASLKELSDSDFGKLHKAIYEYHITDEIPKLDPKLDMAFRFMKSVFEYDSDKYARRCIANKMAINKRWNMQKSIDSLNQINLNDDNKKNNPKEGSQKG